MNDPFIITTQHPAPELLTGFAGVYRKVEQLEQANRDLAEKLEARNPKQPPDSEFLSVAEVAELLGKSVKTIRRWAGREHHPLPATKVFCNEQYTWSFNQAEVLEWFNLHRQS